MVRHTGEELPERFQRGKVISVAVEGSQDRGSTRKFWDETIPWLFLWTFLLSFPQNFGDCWEKMLLSLFSAPVKTT